MSIINSCNLRCQGCWVDVAAKQTKIDNDSLNRTVNEAKAMGNAFFGILGGEPFMHKELLDFLEGQPDVYFQVFTNGHFITDEVAKRLRKMGNVTPLISVEGSEIISDQRRGRDNVLSQTMQGVQNCLNNKVLTGVCTSVCKTNIDDLVTDKWVDRLIEMGVMYTWFQSIVRWDPRRCLNWRSIPISCDVFDNLWSTRGPRSPSSLSTLITMEKAERFCPAVTGFTHHIGPAGDIEPCPIIQLAKERHLRQTLTQRHVQQQRVSARLPNDRGPEHAGCVVLERPDLLVQLAEKHGARDTTQRKTSIADLRRQ